MMENFRTKNLRILSDKEKHQDMCRECPYRVANALDRCERYNIGEVETSHELCAEFNRQRNRMFGKLIMNHFNIGGK